jgi:7-cyano-7-deazaguanine synthase
MSDQKKCVVLLSGGLDSVTALAMAEAEGYACYALSFAYGQRHNAELQAAKKIAQAHQTKDHLILNIDLGRMGGSALTDNKIDVPEQAGEGIPNTYVPARNTVFLSYALAWAEVLNAEAIYIGVNAVDYSGYPDCRPEYIEAFQAMAGLATKAGVEGQKLTIETPLIHMSKAEIIQAGTQMGIDYSLTVSCYQADAEGLACGVCESCRLRKAGFEAAGLQDPTRYQI